MIEKYKAWQSSNSFSDLLTKAKIYAISLGKKNKYVSALQSLQEIWSEIN